MYKAALTPTDQPFRPAARSSRPASTLHSSLSDHSIEAFCMNPSCVNKVTYAVGQPGRKALFCSHNCSTEYAGHRRRLRAEADELQQHINAVNSRSKEGRRLVERLKHVRWHLERYGGAKDTTEERKR